jgi:hypothetical protein
VYATELEERAAAAIDALDAQTTLATSEVGTVVAARRFRAQATAIRREAVSVAGRATEAAGVRERAAAVEAELSRAMFISEWGSWW